jgi:GNAT superfamily N-acetyltransferase
VESVRTATAGDAERFLELSGEFVEAMVSARGASLAPDPGWSVSDRDFHLGRLSDVLADPGRLALVGTLDEVVTGFALCHVEDLGTLGRRGILDACYVEPEARGVGLGRLLMDAVLAWIRDQGCRGVEGVALPGDRGAKNFFETAGFKARMLTMYRALD